MTEQEFDREAQYGQLPTVSRLVAVMRKGKVDDDLTQRLADVVGMVKTAYAEGVKKPGELTIRIKVEPLTDDQVALSIESQAKGPMLTELEGAPIAYTITKGGRPVLVDLSEFAPAPTEKRCLG